MCSIMAFANEYGAALIWLGVMVVLLIIEAATVNLVSIWFAAGALVAAVVAAFGVGMIWQLVLFIAVSLATLLLTRKFVVGVLHVKKTPTNADSVVGQEGIVIQDVDNIDQMGRVRVSGLDWSARSASGEHIVTGTTVTVTKLDGVKLYVEPVK